MRSERFEDTWPFSLCKKWTEEMDIAWQGKKVTGLTAEGWTDRKKWLQENMPWKYWAEDKLDDIRWSINHFIDRYILLEDVRYYLRNRFVTKTHLLRTDVKKGDWAEADTRLFDAIMLLNVDFLEKENNYRDNWIKEECGEENFVPYKPWEVYEVEKKERGEKNCIDGDPDDENSYGMPPHQWQGALARWEVYKWFKETYPTYQTREDELYEQVKRGKGESIMEQFADKTNEEHNRAIYKQIHELEAQLSDEKIENMTKIIKHNESMWT